MVFETGAYFYNMEYHRLSKVINILNRTSILPPPLKNLQNCSDCTWWDFV